MSRNDKSLKTELLISATLAAALLAGCEANGGSPGGANSGGNGSGVVDTDTGIDENGDLTGDGSNADTGFPNDGSVGGAVLEGDVVIAGDASTGGMNFICTQSASLASGARAEAGGNGLVGAALGPLVTLLGGGTVTDLLSGISDESLAIDNDLKTAASMTQTATGLAGLLDSLDLNIILPGEKPAGSYAVAAVSFPSSLLDLGLLSTVSVTTLLNDVAQEDTATFDATGLELLGQSVAGTTYAFVGYKTTTAYDTVRISISSDLLSADAGPNLYVHELCTGGNLVTPPQ